MSGAMWWSDVQRYAEQCGVSPEQVYDMIRAARESVQATGTATNSGSDAITVEVRCFGCERPIPLKLHRSTIEAWAKRLGIA